MTRKELFFELLGNEFKKEGFEFKKAQNAFVKKDEVGNEFVYKFNIWPEFKMIEAGLKILIRQVEEVKKNAWGKKYDKFESLGKEKSYLTKEPSDGHSWTNTEESVRLAVKKEIEFYNSIVKQYFEKHIDLNYLNHILNDKPGTELYVAHNAIQTSFLAIIVAKIVGNVHIGELISIYREVIVRLNPSSLEKYDSLADYLISKPAD